MSAALATTARVGVRPLRWAIVRALRVYQLVLSPWLGPSCRYWPTCSQYAIDAVERHGALRGGGLALRRLARCHPLGGSGVDPVR